MAQNDSYNTNACTQDDTQVENYEQDMTEVENQQWEDYVNNDQEFHTSVTTHQYATNGKEMLANQAENGYIPFTNDHILLDNQSETTLFSNPKLVKNIRPASVTKV